MDYHYTIPGPTGPGSMTGEAHNLTENPTLTTALILDPTGPGYRLDSKCLPRGVCLKMAATRMTCMLHHRGAGHGMATT